MITYDILQKLVSERQRYISRACKPDFARNKTELTTSNGFKIKLDPEFYDVLSVISWSGHVDRNTIYARCGIRYNGKKYTVLMHRLIVGASCGDIVDHIDGDGLNNSKSNLRICNNSQNMMNSVKTKNIKSSKYKGVCFFKATGKYEAHTKINGIKKHIGFYKNEIDAAKAYDKFVIENFGEFARPNFTNELVHV